MPTKYTRRHILLAVFLSLQACGLGILLHNGLYVLFFHVVCKALYGYVCPGDEPVFFIIALVLVPTGFIMGMIGRMWQWVVVEPAQRMKEQGIVLPEEMKYFAPGGNYAWLWRFSKGIAVITGGRVRAKAVFAAVFLLGVIGFVFVRYYIERRLGGFKA